MEIKKILNNNVAVVHDVHGKEKIVMGRGIAYQKKVGETIDLSLVDKEFSLSTPEINHRYQELIQDIPIEFIELGENFISYIKTQVDGHLSDTIHISLVDHIYTSVLRFKDGVLIKNVLLWDIKRFYAKEFEIATHAISLIEQNMDIRLPDDEAGFIALHIVNAQMDDNMEDIYDITEIMQEIMTIVKYYFSIELDENSVYFYRFATHLKFFAQRLIHKKTYNDDQDDGLLSVIKIKYHNAYECVQRITTFILNKYDYSVSNDEQLYLTIHIERLIYKSDK